MESSTTLCSKCNKAILMGEWPFCPHEPSNFGVISDECDVLIKHGICNPDGTPRRYRSKAEIKQAAWEAGLFQGNDTPRVNNKLADARAERDEKKSKRY